VTIWRMRIAYGLPKATETHSEQVVFIPFHLNNGCKKAPQRYVTCIWLVFFLLLIITLKMYTNIGPATVPFYTPQISHKLAHDRFSPSQ
jgi:hypothetical protein